MLTIDTIGNDIIIHYYLELATFLLADPTLTPPTLIEEGIKLV